MPLIILTVAGMTRVCEAGAHSPGVKSRVGQDSLGRKMRKKCRRHFAEIRYKLSRLDFKCHGSLAGAERA